MHNKITKICTMKLLKLAQWINQKNLKHIEILTKIKEKQKIFFKLTKYKAKLYKYRYIIGIVYQKSKIKSKITTENKKPINHFKCWE